MASTLNKTVPITLFMLLVICSFQAMPRVLNEETIVQKHKLWKAQHGRTYGNEAEEEKRFKIFKDNLEYIESFNSLGNRTYELSLNKFADLTNEEFVALYTGYKEPPHTGSSKENTVFLFEKLTEVPSSMDWIQAGAVTSVKEQGICASEGIIQIKTGNLISLSEQQLVDCDIMSTGCRGGWMENAFHYIIQNPGINVPANNEKALLKAASKQPISVCVHATSKGFQFYSNEIFSGKCGTDLNHGVTIVGYGTAKDSTKYWLVKNSWGKYWGEKGYMRIKRDVDAPEGLCGIAKKASYPIA
ncbi:hypothetical protein SLA2020_515360 [Shorea laevis]